MYNDGKWTQGRYNSFVASAIRSAARRWEPRYKTLANAFVGRKTNKATGKMAKHYSCAECSKHFVTTDVQVDHILPVVDPQKGFETWDKFIYNMYCDSVNLQVLCKKCHLVKTKAEKAVASKRKVTSNGTQ